MDDIERLKVKCNNLINIQTGYIARSVALKHELDNFHPTSTQRAEMELKIIQLDGQAVYLDKIIEFYNNRILELEGVNNDLNHITDAIGNIL